MVKFVSILNHFQFLSWFLIICHSFFGIYFSRSFNKDLWMVNPFSVCISLHVFILFSFVTNLLLTVISLQHLEESVLFPFHLSLYVIYMYFSLSLSPSISFSFSIIFSVLLQLSLSYSSFTQNFSSLFSLLSSFSTCQIYNRLHWTLGPQANTSSYHRVLKLLPEITVYRKTNYLST